MSASGVAGGVDVAQGANGAVRQPREQWRFRGRETLWGGYTFLVWTLAANPQGRREVGARFAVFVG